MFVRGGLRNTKSSRHLCSGHSVHPAGLPAVSDVVISAVVAVAGVPVVSAVLAVLVSGVNAVSVVSVVIVAAVDSGQ